jgi:type II secretory pathway pseudopilin PulG
MNSPRQHDRTRLAAAAPLRRRRGQRAFTYIGALVLVAVMGTVFAAAGQVWHTMQRQEKERELLFIGHEFRHALDRYAKHTPRNGRRGPARLEELLQDPRAPGVQRYLRKIYVDPITGSAEWGLVTGANGEIQGVHSLSGQEPLKKTHFAIADRQFEGAARYSEWVFMPGRN